MTTKKPTSKTKKETKETIHKKPSVKEHAKEHNKTEHTSAQVSEKPENKLITERLKKLEEIRKKGINPFPYKYNTSKPLGQIREENQNLPPQSHTGKHESVAGRVMLFRDMGKLSFMTIQDNFQGIQLLIRADEVKEKYEDLKLLDIGDFIGAEGEVITTKTGELSIYVKDFTILSKAIRPLPEKFHGLQDTELKYRKRYLDLIMNKESAETFRKKVLLFRAIREFLDSKGFMEVETPTLQPIYGGAAAKPFTTMHNDLKMKLYLKISDELYLKRLIIGGFSKVYEIDKDFRNEGIDTTHNPEFTMLEAYWAYADYTDMMKLTEDMYEYVALKVNGTTKSNYKGNEIDFRAPWKRMTMLDAIQKYAGIDAAKMTDKELVAFAKKNNVELDKEPCWGNYVSAIFEHFCEDKFIQPTFIIDHPKESTPLCKSHKTDARLIERFEPFCCGMELANAYSELNDPHVQRKMLEDQARQLKAGNDEANPLDEEFIEAMEHGMPPTGGLGIGIDRMAMLILGKESIRDVILFPTMKPEEGKQK